MKVLKNFLVGVVVGYLSIIYAFVLLQAVVGSANVTLVSGAKVDASNMIWIVLIYGVATSILCWAAEIIGKMFGSSKKKK